MANETCNKECMPHIGVDGFWYVGEENTGVRAVGKDGITPNIGADGYWYIWDKNMGVKAVGEPGAKGEKGEKGNQGDQGTTGATGPQGATGPKGDTGSKGPQGDNGATGPRGDQGVQGPQGLQGLPGVQGIKGDKGDTGATGPQGLQGAQGVKGDKGDTGAAGSQGLPGVQGVKGDKGDTGATGPQGVKGDTGEMGPAGPVNIANNLTMDKEGYALDARQGKVLENEVKQINSSLAGKIDFILEKHIEKSIYTYNCFIFGTQANKYTLICGTAEFNSLSGTIMSPLHYGSITNLTITPVNEPELDVKTVYDVSFTPAECSGIWTTNNVNGVRVVDSEYGSDHVNVEAISYYLTTPPRDGMLTWRCFCSLK